MIRYHENPSSFFVKNKQLCTEIAALFADYGGTCTGYCDSYGFGITAKAHYKGMDIRCEFEKAQLTNGRFSWYAESGRNEVYTTIRINRFRCGNRFSLGRSWVFRLLTRATIQKHLAPPYFFRSNFEVDREFIQLLQAFTTRFPVIRIRLRADYLEVVFHGYTPQMLPVPHELERLLHRCT